MSNHFTGLSLGPPFGDQRLDLCDLYAFQSPTDSSRTVLILNANPNADALHPEPALAPPVAAEATPSFLDEEGETNALPLEFATGTEDGEAVCSASSMLVARGAA